MKIAFLCSVYTDAPHLQRLMAALPPSSEFFIHVDAKADATPFRQLLTGPRVHFLEQRYDVVWGSFRQVEYQMALIRAAINSGTAFDYLITMSGMEYPLWSNAQIERYLADQLQTGQQLLQAICMTHQPAGRQRLYVQHWPLINRHYGPGSLLSKYRTALRKVGFALGKRKPLEFDADGHHYQLYKGSDWFGITPELGRFVLDRWDHSPQLQHYFYDSFTPSETAIHTIVFNEATQAAHCLRAEGTYTCLADLTPLTYIDYTPGSVGTLDESYFDTLISSGKMLCRKVVTGKGDRLVQLLDTYRQAHP